MNENTNVQTLNEAYRVSNLFARTFCSPEMMRYLDINLSEEAGESFYDAMIVGVELSRKIAHDGDDAVARLELRIIGPLLDRGMVIVFNDVFYYSSGDILLVRAPDIHWIEFFGEDSDKRCRIHFTSIYRFVEIGFRDIFFQVEDFGGVRPCADFSYK